jgi:(2Fe-2S) ferredoxin
MIQTGLPRHRAFDRATMPAFTHHIFVCGNVRAPGHKRGCCDPDGNQALREAFKKELKTAGFGPLARANHAGCLEQCEHGPTVVIYPQGIWYGGVKIQDVPRIVEKTILGGEILNDLMIADVCLNNPDCPHRADPARRESRG